MIKIKDVTNYLENLAPKTSQEAYDNSGLIVGEPSSEVSSVLVCLDCTEEVVQEAIDKGANLIVAHHPVIFKGLKKLTGSNYVERTVIMAIKHDIAIYAIHTNLDNYRFGVNYEIANRLGLKKVEVLAPKNDVLNKLEVFVPIASIELVREAMFLAGAGEIGNYSECSFDITGTGSFKPQSGSTPFLGKVGEREHVEEGKLEVLVTSHRLSAVVNAMKAAHPYEEVAHYITSLANKNEYEGAGMIGELNVEMSEPDFLKLLKTTFHCGCVRHTELLEKKVKKVALCGGSGSFLLSKAINNHADVFITGDFKYHEFFDAEKKIMIADIGHYESEQFTMNLLQELLKEKFAKFAVHLTEVNTNPINYF